MNWVETKHILYRLREKYWRTTFLGRIAREAVYPPALVGRDLDLLFSAEEEVWRPDGPQNVLDPRLSSLWTEEDRRWAVQSDKLLVAKDPAVIEPKYGLGWTTKGRFYRETRGLTHTTLYPRFADRLKYNQGAASIPQALHFDGFLSRNLYHFFVDAVLPLIMLEEIGLIDHGMPLVVTRDVADRPYFQYLFSQPRFQKWQFVVVEPGQSLRVERLSKAFAHLGWWRSLQADFNGTASNGSRRIFLDRHPRYQRRLKNHDQIWTIAERAGFELVLAEDLTYDEQVELFETTECLIALHGAGMTNILFSDQRRLRALELTSTSLPQPHFHWLSKVLGTSYYDALLGSKFDLDWNYSVDPALFEKALNRLTKT